MATPKAETEKLTPIYPVNLRREPDIGSPLVFCGPKHLHYLTPGKKAELIQYQGDWVQVKVHGEKAWCLSKYMQRV